MTWHALIVWYRLLCKLCQSGQWVWDWFQINQSEFNLTDYGPCKIVDWLCNWPVQCSVTSPQYFTWAGCYLENWLTETWKEWCKAGTLLFIDVAAQFRNLLWLRMRAPATTILLSQCRIEVHSLLSWVRVSTYVAWRITPRSGRSAHTKY